MIPEKLKKLIELLLQRTLAKTAIWNKGSANNQFKLSTSDGIAITIIFWEADNRDPDMFVITIFNATGDAIESFNTAQDEASPESYDLLRQLHKAVSDQYYKVEETMDALLTSLAGAEIIGSSDEYPKTDDDDEELPF